ncbi:MAG: glycosyltransferase [Candidatus Brocadiaceae bacterium]|nr:glycosyltransferase [Candidatus Brocadiaceae bacterium]
MKILHIIDHMGLGGAQQLLRDILPELERKVDGEVHVCVLRSDINEKLPDISRVLITRSCFWNPFVIFKVAHYIRSHNIDILHLHLLRSMFIGLVVGLFMRVKIIVHIHRDLQLEPSGFRVLLLLFKRRIAFFIAVSMEHMEQIKHLFLIELTKIILIRSFINLVRFNRNNYYRIALRIENGFSESDFIIGYFGRLSLEKQPWYIIEIARKLVQENDRFKFIIVGKGGLHKELESMIQKYALQNNVHLLGYRDDIPELLSTIDIGIFTSSLEGMPVSAIEMMAMGKPIVAFTIPAFNEIIEEGVNGYLVEMGDVTGFCDKIYHLSNDTDILSKLGKKSIESVKQFDLQIACNKFLELYQRVENPVSSD